MKRTHNQNKSLYESIMRDVAKTVKRRLNESSNSSAYSDGWKTAIDDIKFGKIKRITADDYKRGYNDAIDSWLEKTGGRYNDLISKEDAERIAAEELSWDE